MKAIHWFAIVILSALFIVQPVAAQSQGLTLSVSRNYGYSSGGEIRGTFTMRVTGPEDLTSVSFWVDDQLVGTVTQPPFKIAFQTQDYAFGLHYLRATGLTGGGETVASDTRSFNFVGGAEEMASVQRILLPLLGGILVVVLLVMGAQYLAFRPGHRKHVPLGAARQYGIAGGAVCSKCHRPFALHLWGLNVSPVHRLDRCEHCGRWGLYRAASREDLARAERAELAMAAPETPIPEASEEEKLRQGLDESKYI